MGKIDLAEEEGARQRGQTQSQREPYGAVIPRVIDWTSFPLLKANTKSALFS